ncbi:hypothetical protein P153DRAFT_213622 [Dothidotthia symphoricarpi CBS 119687]|uniref:Transmembrane protein n=1 Tax=Dothidotthia symphoricarpi CBS 119687 TaxID=1392245 RepID=A0A6A6AEF1_9PLEO|nr:uncharacterized protein P153DRAFT_213622 [Dothidotthia symphoricarpi CBS 119687]KAF2130190.1 hypothetical protein P153DRAFT_213622 [Dothidotthia symphoricarpi CBS 119687]
MRSLGVMRWGMRWMEWERRLLIVGVGRIVRMMRFVACLTEGAGVWVSNGKRLGGLGCHGRDWVDWKYAFQVHVLCCATFCLVCLCGMLVLGLHARICVVV